MLAQQSAQDRLTPMLLDDTDVPAATMAFGLRRLRAAYTGYCLIVRRTSDDETVYVAFDAQDRISGNSVIVVKTGSYSGTLTLGDFTKSTDAMITTWYDQSGNANNLTMTTAGSQPKIVDDGTCLTTVEFDGSADLMKTAYEFESTTDDFTYLALVKRHSAASGLLGFMSDLKTYNSGSEIDCNADEYSLRIDSTDLDTGLAPRTNAKDLIIASYDPALSSNEQKVRINGKLFQQDCTEDIAAASREPFSIGVRRSDDGGYAVDGYWHGDIQEVVCWETALDASEAAGVEANIMSYHSITNPESQWAVALDGTNDYVDCGTGLGDALGDNYAGSLTVSMWFKAGVTSGNDGLFTLGDFSSSNGEFQILLSSNILRFWLNNNGWQREVAFTDTASWHHLVCIYETGSESDSKMYLDGIAVGSTTGTFPSAANMDFDGLKTIIGAYWSSSYPLDGNIDEVSIWTQALSASEVSNLFNNGRPGKDLRSLEPEAWWKMGDGSPTGIILDEADTGSKALYLPGVASNYASVPDAADLDGFGDFTLEATDVTMSDWTPAAFGIIISKYNISGSQRAWSLGILTDGKLQLTVSLDGGASATSYASSVATGIADGATADILVLRTSTLVRFYVNGAKLGDDVAASSTTLPNSSAPVEIGTANAGGSNPFLGSLTRARVWNSATPDSSTPVLDIDFSLADKGTSSFTATSGQTVTINTSGAPPAAIRGATDGALTNGASLTAATKPYKFSSLSCEFDGTNDYVDTGFIPDFIHSDATLSFWCNMDNFTGFQALGCYSSGKQFYVGFNGTNAGYALQNTGKSSTDISSYISTGTWHHICLVARDGTASYYVDGVSRDTHSYTQDAAANPETPIYIGAIPDGSGGSGIVYPMEGKVDEVAIFDRALTAAEVLGIYGGNQAPTSLFTSTFSPVSWWRLGEGADLSTTTIPDAAGDYPATLENGAAIQTDTA